MTLAGPVRSDYYYDVVFTASTDPNPEPTSAPLPVIGTTDPNGRVAGLPTHIIEYAPPTNLGPFPFVLYTFNPPPTPDNPDSLAMPPPSNQRISIFNTVTQDSNTLQFTIFTNYLTDATTAQQLQSLQVQMLTMNHLALPGTGGSRAFDFLGTPSRPDFVKVDLRGSNSYNNTQGASAGLESSGDTADPSLDIIDWSIDVQRP